MGVQINTEKYYSITSGKTHVNNVKIRYFLKGESYFRDKKLLYGNIIHYPYKKTLGANYYVTKFIGSDKIEWDIIKTPTKK